MSTRLNIRLLESLVYELLLCPYNMIASHSVQHRILLYHVNVVHWLVCRSLFTTIGARLITIEVVLHLRVKLILSLLGPRLPALSLTTLSSNAATAGDMITRATTSVASSVSHGAAGTMATTRHVSIDILARSLIFHVAAWGSRAVSSRRQRDALRQWSTRHNGSIKWIAARSSLRLENSETNRLPCLRQPQWSCLCRYLVDSYH